MILLIILIKGREDMVEQFKKEEEVLKEEIKNTENVVKEGIKKGENFFKKMFSLMPDYLKTRFLTAIVLMPIAILLIYSPKVIFDSFVVLVAIIMSYEWTTIMSTKEDDSNFFKICGLAYILIPLSSLIYIKSTENGSDIVFWLFLILWATDIFALIVGRTFGGPKLAPTISPNKTWSGSFGGLLASMFIGLLSSVIFKESAVFFIIFAGFISIAEQCGDLLESKFKRHFGVKDSGNIIPGHGGIMDRIDGLTFVAPIIALVVMFSNNIF